MSKRARHVLFVLLLNGGCREGLDDSCEQGLGSYTFRFVGPARGEGSLVIERGNASREMGVELTIPLGAAGQAPEPTAFRTVGICELGQIDARFPGAPLGDGSIAQILGIELLGTLSRREHDAYGTWTVELTERDEAQEVNARAMFGFWRAAFED